jgi:hypothetical protein
VQSSTNSVLHRGSQYGSVANNYCAGPIETVFSCCFCYREYPDFILENFTSDGSVNKWSKHVATFGKKESHTNGREYWFCVQPGQAIIDTNVKTNITDGTTIAVVTGKFAHEDQFQYSVEDFCDKVKATSLVEEDNVICMHKTPMFISQDERFSRHLQYRKEQNDVSAKGGGYWIHKVLLLRYQMNRYKDNDIILWVDNDRLDFFAQGTFKTVLEAMDKRKADFVVETQAATEYSYTKEDVMVAFNATEEMRTSLQVNANALLVRNSPKMRRFLDATIECASDWHMISDEASFFPNHPDFQDHRHDQSIISMMVKKFMSDKLVIGPPAQPYQFGFTAYHTYKLFENDSDGNSINQPYCPFPSFYKMHPYIISNSTSV